MARSDAELVMAARDGDRSAFAALVARHRAALLVACGRLLRDDALAEDAAQEATLTAYLELSRLRDPTRFGAWLIGIGLNTGRRWLRTRARQALREIAKHPERDPLDAAASPMPGPDDIAEARDLAGRVRRAVAALPPGQRRAVVGYYLLGLPQAEVAALLGTSNGAIKTRLHKARAALIDALADDWAIEEEHVMSQSQDDAVAMRVADVCRIDGDGAASHAVILEEVAGSRSLAMWIGEPEGTALAAALTDADLPRPMTHTLAVGLLTEGGVGIRGVRVTRLAERTFYAVVSIDGPGGAADVDARPSDALTLAVLAGAPIEVDAGVLTAHERQVAEGAPTADRIRARSDQRAAEITDATLAARARHLADPGPDPETDR